MQALFRISGARIALATLCAVGTLACSRPEREPERALPTGLPKAKPLDFPSSRLRVFVRRDGGVEIANHLLLSDDEIAEALRAFHRRHPAGSVTVVCHPAAIHGRGSRVLDLVRTAKITRFDVQAMNQN